MSIKSILKHSPISGLITKIADIWSDPTSISLCGRLANAGKETAVLIGTPCHHNLGDHLIASNEVAFLKEKCKFVSVIEIPTRIFLHNRLQIISHVDKCIPIFVTGGGWMGDIWPEDQEILETIVSSFPQNHVIVLPQTVFYSDITKAKEKIEHTNQVFSGIASLSIFCRDQLSYNTVIDAYRVSVSNVYLVPDIGLYRKPLNRKTNSRTIRCCLRDDRESISSSQINSIINKIAKQYDYIIENDSTLTNKPIPVWKREKKIKELIDRFNDSTLVVTDRLHGMVFSALANVKCVVFDNRTHKVSGVYELWLKNNPKIRYINNIQNTSSLINEVVHVLNTEIGGDYYYSNLLPLFTEMATVICSILNTKQGE